MRQASMLLNAQVNEAENLALSRSGRQHCFAADLSVWRNHIMSIEFPCIY